MRGTTDVASETRSVCTHNAGASSRLQVLLMFCKSTKRKARMMLLSFYDSSLSAASSSLFCVLVAYAYID